jgi:hypothetical protein
MAAAISISPNHPPQSQSLVVNTILSPVASAAASDDDHQVVQDGPVPFSMDQDDDDDDYSSENGDDEDHDDDDYYENIEDLPLETIVRDCLWTNDIEEVGEAMEELHERILGDDDKLRHLVALGTHAVIILVMKRFESELATRLSLSSGVLCFMNVLFRPRSRICT